MRRSPASLLGLFVAVVLLTACAPDERPAERITLRGEALAGPTCPVVSEPPDPACAESLVVGAVIVVTDVDGGEVARATTDAEGRFEMALPPGSYVVVPQPVEGLMGTPSAVAVELRVGAVVDRLVLSYDTGIR